MLLMNNESSKLIAHSLKFNYILYFKISDYSLAVGYQKINIKIRIMVNIRIDSVLILLISISLC